MKRAITSLKNANQEVLREIGLLYPKGVDDEHLVSFPTVSGKNIRALEIELNDTIYLVKLEADEQPQSTAKAKGIDPPVDEAPMPEA